MKGIYLITNLINNKKYVGKSKASYKIRWSQHCHNARNGMTTYLCKAIRKYGADNFKIELIDCEYSNEKEIYWISKLMPEYNMTKGGDGGFINDQTGKTWKVSDTSKMKIGYMKGLEKRKAIYIPKISGSNNYQCTYIITTPWGIFYSWIDATDRAKELRRLDKNVNVISDNNTLQKYCKSNILLNPNGRRTPKEWRGKYTNDIGFSFKEINEDKL